jgi:glyoxylase-like metal-dependent hydrolase (beta-lactamase superfamily II)
MADNEISIFNSKRLDDSLTAIYEDAGHGGIHVMYLVSGSKQAALVDTGNGLDKGLYDLVTHLTDKPVICLLTHGDPDHIGGAALFDPVYMNSRDENILFLTTNEKLRSKEIYRLSRHDPALCEYVQKNAVRADAIPYQPINDGDVFDLGGIHLEVMELPGHSYGSVGFFCKETGYALTGDTVTRTPWL